MPLWIALQKACQSAYWALRDDTHAMFTGLEGASEHGLHRGVVHCVDQATHQPVIATRTRAELNLRPRPLVKEEGESARSKATQLTCYSNHLVLGSVIFSDHYGFLFHSHPIKSSTWKQMHQLVRLRSTTQQRERQCATTRSHLDSRWTAAKEAPARPPSRQASFDEALCKAPPDGQDLSRLETGRVLASVDHACSPHC